MGRRVSYNEIGHAHQLTFSVYRRVPVFSDPANVQIFLRHLVRASQQKDFGILAFVVMPDHAHVIVFPRGKYEIPSILKSIKARAAREILEGLPVDSPWLKTFNGAKPRRVWQAGGGHDRNYFNAKALLAAINYDHMNPVRKGLCTLATDWEWSSARAYEGMDCVIDVEILEI